MLEWRGALVDRKSYLKPASVDSHGQHSSIYVFLCLCVCLFVVSVFKLTRVDTCTEITCTLSMYIYMYVHACTCVYMYVYVCVTMLTGLPSGVGADCEGTRDTNSLSQPRDSEPSRGRRAGIRYVWPLYGCVRVHTHTRTRTHTHTHTHTHAHTHTHTSSSATVNQYLRYHCSSL